MNDETFTQPLDADGSESRFNRITTPVEPLQPPEDQVETAPLITQAIKTPSADPEPMAVQPQPSPLQMPLQTPPTPKAKKRGKTLWVVLALAILLIFFTPFRITTLVLGIDRPPKDTWIGRSDTMILTTIPPILPQVSMLSIPRDLWVTIPNHYENRINTAHYFAELEAADTGMQAAREVVELNFGIPVNYVVRIKFDGFVDVVDALGGVTVDLPKEMSGLPAGKNHLDGTQALKFVRDRTGSDDFFRQQRGQLFISAAFKEILNPLKWPRLPVVAATAAKAIETDMPFWLWPRMAYSFLFSAVSGFDSHTIDRNFITPWVTNEGAQVLLPNWEQINPMVDKIFRGLPLGTGASETDDQGQSDQ